MTCSYWNAKMYCSWVLGGKRKKLYLTAPASLTWLLTLKKGKLVSYTGIDLMMRVIRRPRKRNLQSNLPITATSLIGHFLLSTGWPLWPRCREVRLYYAYVARGRGQRWFLEQHTLQWWNNVAAIRSNVRSNIVPILWRSVAVKIVLANRPLNVSHEWNRSRLIGSWWKEWNWMQSNQARLDLLSRETYTKHSDQSLKHSLTFGYS